MNKSLIIGLTVIGLLVSTCVSKAQHVGLVVNMRPVAPVVVYSSPPPVVYYQPAPVYYVPPPVVCYQPAPVYYAPYCPPPVVTFGFGFRFGHGYHHGPAMYHGGRR